MYTFCGSNRYRIRREIGKLRQHHADAEQLVIDAEQAAPAEIIQALSGQSLFQAKVLVVLRQPSQNKAVQEAVEDIIAAAGNNTILIFEENTIDKRSRFYKYLKQHTEFYELGEPTREQAIEFVQHYVKHEKQGNINAQAAGCLVDRIGTEQQQLVQELDKLVLFNPEIDQSAIEQLVEPSFQETIFNMTDALVAGRSQHILELYRGLRLNRIHPQEVIGALAWQLEVLLKIKAFQAHNQSNSGNTQISGLHPFVVQKNVPIARRLNWQDIRAMIQTSAEADQTLKSQQTDPDAILETLLLELTATLSKRK